MTKYEFNWQSATLCALMAGSSDKATRQQAARDATSLLETLPLDLRNSPHCARSIDALRTLIARVETRDSPRLACIRDGDWVQITDGELDVRVDFTHREKAVEYRLLYVEDHPWTVTPFHGSEFVLDAAEVWGRVNDWLESQ